LNDYRPHIRIYFSKPLRSFSETSAVVFQNHRSRFSEPPQSFPKRKAFVFEKEAYRFLKRRASFCEKKRNFAAQNK